MKIKHPALENKKIEKIYHRVAARGIIIHEGKILLIYTQKYDDYSLPGGGVDRESGESIEKALIREIEEETGAKNISIQKPFGIFEEIRPIHYPEYDAMEQISYIYWCDSDPLLGEAKPEDYEVKNGSVPIWVKLDEAIAHNKKILDESPEHMGFSVEREKIIMEMIKEELENMI